jgi:hypothetical protein
MTSSADRVPTLLSGEGQGEGRADHTCQSCQIVATDSSIGHDAIA